ncbi:MAG: 16S rRNA (adenine(1518)-N(6)/adenine(1519)-N(6))-dimethyltransferase RsmA [Deltaproteobacteria bacterium]|nr:16S rRNA (adenine(1518)-N(6)/adenine(1519)-N(6))-dimethyltransferase RsmA [Deltaproteobacteria bacterium]
MEEERNIRPAAPDGWPRPKKSLGQNFLQDKNIARKIVEQLRIAPTDRVLEIGPGPGMLTGFLLEADPACLCLVEKDHHWAAERQSVFLTGAGAESGRVRQVILADALTMPWEKFHAPWKIMGNLPYNVASPLIWDILSKAPGLTRAVFMVQKEVGQRLAAAPGTSAYGALSVWVQSFAVPRLEFGVPPQVFRPAPKVHSAVVSFTPLPIPEQPADPEALSNLLKLCFQKRRKQLGGILRAQPNWQPGEAEKFGVEQSARPEELTPRQFQDLAVFLKTLK